LLSNSALVSEKKNTWKSYTVLAPVFAHPLISCIRFLHIKCKIIGKAKMETTTMWLLTIIIIKDIKCFQICAYFEGLGTNFLYSFWEPSKVCMRDITERCNIYHKLRVGLLTLVKNVCTKSTDARTPVPRLYSFFMYFSSLKPVHCLKASFTDGHWKHW
jgi:hypothetical protein